MYRAVDLMASNHDIISRLPVNKQSCYYSNDRTYHDVSLVTM